MVGGGNLPRPGEISLADQGLLFLDELPEFGRAALEALRQPLEEGEVQIVRARDRAILPARFMLLAAMYPCPCGHASEASPGRCDCTQAERSAYLRRISGPILDRIDLHIEAPPLKSHELHGPPDPLTSAEVRGRVQRAREIQRRRLADIPGARCNAHLRGEALRELCRPTENARAVLKGMVDLKGLTARAHDRVLKVARTIADLEQSPLVHEHHVNEAVDMRCLDRPAAGRRGVSPLTIARHAALHKSPGTAPGEHRKEGT